ISASSSSIDSAVQRPSETIPTNDSGRFGGAVYWARTARRTSSDRDAPVRALAASRAATSSSVRWIWIGFIRAILHHPPSAYIVRSSPVYNRPRGAQRTLELTWTNKHLRLLADEHRARILDRAQEARSLLV